jgi:RNA polymerase subunit RPABC4/transcription elongation factor Spt4
VSELPCVACGEPIRSDAQNCPACGQRQLTRRTLVSYVVAVLPAIVFGTAGAVGVLAPGLVASSVGVRGLILGATTVYLVAAIVVCYAYQKRRALLGDLAGDEGLVD